jgi:hypothetical protein
VFIENKVPVFIKKDQYHYNTTTRTLPLESPNLYKLRRTQREVDKIFAIYQTSNLSSKVVNKYEDERHFAASSIHT